MPFIMTRLQCTTQDGPVPRHADLDVPSCAINCVLHLTMISYLSSKSYGKQAAEGRQPFVDEQIKCFQHMLFRKAHRECR